MVELIAFILALVSMGLAYAYWQLRTQVERDERATSIMGQLLDEKQTTIKALQTSLDAQITLISETQTRLEKLASETSDYRKTIERQQQELLQLHETLNEQHTVAADLQTTLNDRSKQVTQLSEDLQAEREKVATFEQQIEQKERARRYEIALTLTLANVAFDALVVVDTESKIIAANNAAETLFADKQRILGQKLAVITDNPTFELLVEDALINEEESFEEQIGIKDRAYRVRAQVIHRDGNRFIALALQDVTQLIRLNRARRDMVANISHELRTPIANIRLIIESLFSEQSKPKRKDSISSLRAIASETESLLWLVQEMADLSMIESGQAIVRMVEFPLADIVNDALERLIDQIAAKNLSIVRHVPDRIHVLCDRDLIQRVLVNLIHNAMKWSPEGEAITISAMNGDDEVTISVFDNGPGVPEDQVDRIFERFYQVDASRSGNEGTGLGLAICRHIVEAHGGGIWAESNSQGSGGRFKFTLLAAPSDDLLAVTPISGSDEEV